MPEQQAPLVQIKDGIVQVYKQELVKEVALVDFMPHIEFRPPVTIGLLPKTAIMVHWDESDPKKKIARILAELPPGVRTCQYNDRKFTISIPWTYFLLDFNTAGDPMSGAMWQQVNSRTFWAKEQVRDGNSILYKALVPNVDNHGQICWGSTGIDGKLPLGIRVDRIVSEFYQTMFTHSNGAGSPWQTETGRDTWNRWHKETEKDPAAFMRFPEWESKEYGKVGTVAEVLSMKTPNRLLPIQMDGIIPDRVLPATFGNTEEWLKNMTPFNRYQIRQALDNLVADDPATIQAPPPLPALDADDDGPGGVPA